MKIRSVLIVALAASLTLGITGCNLIQPQATRITYEPSDGVGVDVGELQLRNLILLSDDGIVGQLMFGAVNTTGKPITLNVSFMVDGMVSAQSVVIESSERPVGFGGAGQPQVQLTEFGVAPGGTLQLSFQAGDSETKTTFVPVLTTAQPDYAGLTPTPTPTPTPTATLTPTPSPTPETTEG